MTDRYTGFIVTLDSDLRSDDAEQTISAINQIKGVIKIEPIVSDFSQRAAEARVKLELGRKLYEVLK